MKFQRSNEAVSPVIGVILMVAITVVLASVTYIVISSLKGEDVQPQMSFQLDENADKITLVQAPTNLAWDEFRIQTSALGVGEALCFGINAEAQDEIAGCVEDVETAITPSESGEVANTQISQAATPIAVSGGDFFDFCGTLAGVGTQLEDILVAYVHVPSNTVVTTQQLASVAACA